ncbi:type IV pilin protein [Pseudomonas sp. GV071]|uniref:type IV pilin protein n=1 Tax=Pseudomonas sp. GV071 TaxID=2135754 RepID=UPI000D34B3F5|nr:type IV pilin protein [Pseudomonas sp. GV071]PTQ67679.1 type IV pilus assembly protein PilE [Pseudomonas sp. GV071]
MIKNARTMQGYTLVELMLVVTVIGILAAIVYPNYQEYVMRSNRTEGQALLNDAAARQERYFAQNNAYADTSAKLGLASDQSPNKLYTLSISNVAAGTSAYTLTVTPARTDAKCGNLTINQAGTKGTSVTTTPAADCFK